MLPQEVGQLFRFCSVEKSSNRVVVDRDFACVLRLSFSPLGFYRRGYRILAPYVKVVLSFSLRRLAPGCFTRVQRPRAAAPCEFPVDFVARLHAVHPRMDVRRLFTVPYVCVYV